jgi:capsular polysaccharide export protein
VPLQVHIDAQVRVHSRFGTVPAFLETVIASFAVHARKADFLAIKHHPLDRGYHDYAELIRALGRKYGLQDRLLYIHDQHLPTLLANARGVVVINSTVGLSAIHHGTPLKVLGEALYDMPGLTAQCELSRFWRDAEQWKPNEELYQAFRAHVIAKTQLNGSFYRPGLFSQASAARRTPEQPIRADVVPDTRLRSHAKGAE